MDLVPALWVGRLGMIVMSHVVQLKIPDQERTLAMTIFAIFIESDIWRVGHLRAAWRRSRDSRTAVSLPRLTSAGIIRIKPIGCFEKRSFPTIETLYGRQ